MKLTHTTCKKCGQPTITSHSHLTHHWTPTPVHPATIFTHNLLALTNHLNHWTAWNETSTRNPRHPPHPTTWLAQHACHTPLLTTGPPIQLEPEPATPPDQPPY